MRQQRGREGADEGDLHRDVDHRADEEGAEHGSGEVSLGVGALAADLERPLEAHEGEGDPAGRDGAEYGLAGPAPPCTKKPPAAVKLWMWKPASDQGQGGEGGDRQLEHRDRRVGPGQQPDAQEVQRDEDAHEHDGRDETRGAERPCARVVEAVGPRVGRQVLDGGEHLDRRDRRRLDVGEPAERRAGQAPEGVVGESARASALGEHGAELGVDESEGRHEERGDHPADQRSGPGDGDRDERTEEPTRPERGPGRDPQQAEEPDVAAEPLVGAVLHGLLPATGRRAGDRDPNIASSGM